MVLVGSRSMFYFKVFPGCPHVFFSFRPYYSHQRSLKCWQWIIWWGQWAHVKHYNRKIKILSIKLTSKSQRYIWMKIFESLWLLYYGHNATGWYRPSLWMKCSVSFASAVVLLTTPNFYLIKEFHWIVHMLYGDSMMA